MNTASNNTTQQCTPRTTTQHHTTIMYHKNKNKDKENTNNTNDTKTCIRTYTRQSIRLYVPGMVRVTDNTTTSNRIDNTHLVLYVLQTTQQHPFFFFLIIRTNVSDVPRSLQSRVSTIQTVALTADVFQLFTNNTSRMLLQPAG